jgi:hypothetical protein
MRWLMNGMVSGGAPLSAYVDEAALLQTSLHVLQAKAAGRPAAKHFTGGIELNDPAEAGWIVVVPDDDEGRRIAAALAPLIEHRVRVRDPDAGHEPYAPEQVTRYFPATAAAQPALGEWFEKNIASPISGDIMDGKPFYVLLAGSPQKIPFELDHMIFAGNQTVGRLSFPDVESYRNYADKVVAWEPDDDAARTPRKDVPLGIFAPDHGPQDPTHLSRRYLADELAGWFAAKDATRRRVARIGEDASRDALLGLLRGDAPVFSGPRLLFSASHGLAIHGEGNAHRVQRRATQGAICCQDARYLDDEILTADALGGGALLPGGVWMLFACFGAGTPVASDFFRALGDPTLLGFHDGGPFIAALPTRLLANPDGPLAVIAHLDPGFIHSFSDPVGVGGERRAAILKVIQLLLVKGTRVGVATDSISGQLGSFGERLRQMNHVLEDTFGKPAGALAATFAAKGGDPEIVELRHKIVDLAVAYDDFRNFSILGDPAVKVPRAGARRAAARAAAASTATAGAPVAARAQALPAAMVEAQRDDRLVFATAEALFSSRGVALRPGGATVIVLTSTACGDVASVHEQPAEGGGAAGGPARRYYEAVEHQDCDLVAEIRFSAAEARPAPQLRLRLTNGVRLRYGEAISLFGDFYGIPGVRVGDAEEAFLRVFATFEHGDNAEMRRILGVMARERRAVEGAPGGDTAAAYEHAGDELNGDYNRATGGGSPFTALFPKGRFLDLAAVNYDHFAFDALAAYRAGHAAACHAALAARGGGSDEERRRLLERAYLMNACADHFLTDLFASGHLRVPRREIAAHGWFQIVGDLLAKRMHDEDNARGLLVKNGLGEAWRTYGDRHFHAPENEVGRRLVREAVRASAAEVWAAFDAEAEPRFAALDIVPDIGDALTSTANHAPLLVIDGGVLKRRKDLFDPGCREWVADFSSVWALLRTAAKGGF